MRFIDWGLVVIGLTIGGFVAYVYKKRAGGA
jgi:hypothetical protein